VSRGRVDALQVIAEPRRREILRLVWDRELSAGAIAAEFDVSFAAVSQHLGVLRDARLVRLRRDGRFRFYRADRAALGDLRPALELMWTGQLDRLAHLAEKEERRSVEQP
jgi:DNA-binding transcriptional ArsR family regulator